jgi:3-phosphoshikimate 1-carboxyvinyltransferase
MSGARVVAGADSIAIEPPAGFGSRAGATQRVDVATYDDHRMAMCFSLAAFGPRPVRILDPGCVAKTFPRYFDAFRALVG